ncbi:MAG TPA: hypothetical protein VHB20_06895 [Verrucomicrobiae bacterium]|jgi:hypothetical protein|nr:hypothetical protein [Verrucomicrobiae bacterium]
MTPPPSLRARGLRALWWTLLLARAARAGDVELTVGHVEASRGGTITVPVQIHAGNCAGLQFDFVYPGTFLWSGYPFTALGGSSPLLLSSLVNSQMRRVVLYSHANTALPQDFEIYLPLTALTNAANTTFQISITGLIAAGADGAAATPTAVTNGALQVVTVAPARFDAPQTGPHGELGLQFTGGVGAAYILQTSTNLVNWSNVSTYLTDGGVIALTFPSTADSASRFYRAQTGP